MVEPDSLAISGAKESSKAITNDNELLCVEQHFPLTFKTNFPLICINVNF